MINLSTIFEVSVSTHYEDTKDDTKCKNGVVWGYLRSLKVTATSTIP